MIEEGTEAAELLVLRATVTPPLGAPALNATVHVVVPAPVMDWLAHCSD